MPTILEQRILEFVDRMAEMQGFSGFVESEEKLVMFVWGPTGMGKSFLLTRMNDECKRHGIRCVLVECQDLGLNSYQQVMCEVRDKLKNPELFQEFNRLTEWFSAPRQVNLSILQSIGTVQSGASIKGAEIGTINIASGVDTSVPEAERMVRLTEQFVESLERAAEGGRLVLLLDDTHKMTSETTLWLWARLLKRLLDAPLPTVRFVVAARERPELDRYMWRIIEEVQLQPLEPEHIAAYLKLRGVGDTEGERQLAAATLYASSNGNPLKVANLVDTIQASLARKAPST